MKTNLQHRYPAQKVFTAQRGIALIASLIIMVLMTIIGLSILRGNNLFERVSGNTREKQRAFQSAQDALLFGEWWLNSGVSVTNVACSTSAALTALAVCTTDPGTSVSAIKALQVYSGYSPQNMTVSAGGGLASSGDVKYTQTPGIYINCIAPCGAPLPSGQTLFRVTAIGYGGTGGTNGAVAIVQSVYALGGSSNPISSFGL